MYFFTNTFSQHYDLIITDNGDSIACIINIITDSTVYFEMKDNHKWFYTSIKRDQVVEYKYDAIYEYMVLFKPGTSYIDLTYDKQEAELRKQQAEMKKAQRQKKIGITTTVIGGVFLASAIVWVITDPLNQDYTMMLREIPIIGNVGFGLLSIGIPVSRTGNKRIRQIAASRSAAYHSITLDLKPCVQYNRMNHNYEPGLALKISF